MSRSLRRRYQVAGTSHEVDVAEDHGRLRVRIDGREVAGEMRPLRALPGGADVVVTCDGGRSRAVVIRDGDTVHVALRGRTYRVAVLSARADGDTAAAGALDAFVGSPMTGVVRTVAAEPGRSYAAGDTLAVVEAMKMEFAVEAPRAVVVDEVRAKAGDRVDIGQTLVTFKAAP